MGRVASGDEAAVVEHQGFVGAGLHRLDAGEDAIELGVGVELLVLLGRAGAPHVDGEERKAARQHFRPGQLPLGDDDDRRGADGQARILVGRALHAARHHQADVHAVAHGVGLDDVEQARRERLAGHADVDAQHLGAVPQAVEVPVEEGDAPAVEPEAFPDAVAEDEAGIEHGDLGVRTADEFAVDADEDVVVARVADVILRAGGGDGWIQGRGSPVGRGEDRREGAGRLGRPRLAGRGKRR